MPDGVEEWIKEKTRHIVDEELSRSSAAAGEVPGLPEHQPVRVPLTIYIGEERHILGEAEVVGNQVFAYVLPGIGRDLGDLIRNGSIQNMSVAFNTPPSTPKVTDGGRIRWIRNY
jgi:hypothetical protein